MSKLVLCIFLVVAAFATDYLSCTDPAYAKAPNSCCINTQEDQNPVCDFTGKCVFLSRHTTFVCQKNTAQTTYSGGTDTTIAGSVNYYYPDYIVAKDFSNSMTQAFAAAGMVDSSLHIWSGWNGKCEHGTFSDFSWLSDPMFLLQTAMQMYQVGGEGYFGDTVKGAIKETTSTFNSVADKATSYFSSESSNLSLIADNAANGSSTGFSFAGMNYSADGASGLVSTPISNTTSGIADIGSAQSFMDRLTSMNQIIGDGVFQNVTYTNVAMGVENLAASIDASSKTQATKNTKQLIGGSTNDVIAQSYTTCMESLGLSFANQIGFSAGADSSITGININTPWQNPLRMSAENFGALATIVGQKFFEMSYMANGPDVMNMYTVIALNSVAYAQVGQIVCGGYKTAVATNALNTSATKANASQSNAIMMSVASSALNMLPPPYNLAGSIAFKVLTSFSSGNACTDLTLAQTQGQIQYKTNIFINNSPTPCIHTGSECAAKWFWGDCMRTREKYCCYDQITTRIFAETAYMELGLSMSNGCSQLTINDLKNVGFEICKNGQTPQANKCMPQSEYDQFKQALYIQMSQGVPVDNLVQSIKNSLTGLNSD